MPESVQNVIDYLIGIQLHPVVTVVVFIVLALGRQRFEEVQEAWADRRRVGQWVLLAAFVVSACGQWAVYWPTKGQDMAISLFMSLGQVGIASFVYTYAAQWGIMDRLGKIVQKKIDDKAADAKP